MEEMRIYVADLAAYNEGKLIGEWLDLSDYDSAEELMQAIQNLVDKWSEEQGVTREEWAIHDYENIPTNLASEYMGEKDFEKLYKLMEVAEETGIPMDVIIKWMSYTGVDNPEDVENAYVMEVEDPESYAMHLVDETGMTGDYRYHGYVTETDRRVVAGDMESSFREDAEYEGELSEEEIEEQADAVYDEWYEGLADPVDFLVDEQGIYSEDELPAWVQFDYASYAKELEHDHNFITGDDGQTYVFASYYKKGGKVERKLYAVEVQEKKGSPFKVHTDKLSKHDAKKLRSKLRKSGKYHKVQSDIPLPFSLGGKMKKSDWTLESFLKWAHKEISFFLEDTIGSKLSKDWEFTHDGKKYHIESYVQFNENKPKQMREASFEILDSSNNPVGTINYSQKTRKYTPKSNLFSWDSLDWIKKSNKKSKKEGGKAKKNNDLKKTTKNSEEKRKLGAFTRKALRNKKLPIDYAKEVLAHPEKHSRKTVQAAQIVKNTNSDLFDDGGKAGKVHPIFGHPWSANSYKRYNLYRQGFKSRKNPLARAVTGKKLATFYDLFDGYVEPADSKAKEYLSSEVKEALKQKNDIRYKKYAVEITYQDVADQKQSVVYHQYAQNSEQAESTALDRFKEFNKEFYKKITSASSKEIKKRGGKIPSARARDRRYSSEQPHEIAYRKKRKSPVVGYNGKKKKKSSGGTVEADLPASLLNRIAKTNTYIHWAIQHNLIIEIHEPNKEKSILFTHPIGVKGDKVSITYFDYKTGSVTDTFDTKKKADIESLRKFMSDAMSGIKKAAQDQDYTIPKFSLGGIIVAGMVGGWAGYKLGLMREQKKWEEAIATEKAIAKQAGKALKKGAKKGKDAIAMAAARIKRRKSTAKTGGKVSNNDLAREKWVEVMNTFKSGDLKDDNGNSITDRNKAANYAYKQARGIQPLYGRMKKGGTVREKAEKKFIKVMREFYKGTLMHGTTEEAVTDVNQAQAIAYSEARDIDPKFGKEKKK